MLAAYLGVPRKSEILVIIFLGICFLSLDFSLFQLKSNLQEIWRLELKKSKYLETCVKYIISAVVLVRTFTLHAFLAFYVVMLWPAIFEEKPNLMLPWLLLGIIRCLIINGITLVLGIFVCYLEKGFSPICFDYILAQIIEHGPSVYAWMSVLSFYRAIAGVHSSLQSSTQSLCSNKQGSTITAGSLSQEGNLDKTKSYSLSDLNLDYLYSNRVRRLPGEKSIEILINELKDLFTKKRIIRDGSKSFDSLIQANGSARLEVTESLTGPSLTVLEKTMKVLEVSDEDILNAKKDKGRFVQILKEISVEDVEGINDNHPSISSCSYKSKGTRNILKSHSQNEDIKSQEICLYYLRKQLKLEQSNQTLLETEIANITFNEAENQDSSKTCRANKWKCASVKKEDLNRYRMAVGSRFEFNPNVFLRKFVLKKNTSKNFGCQVSTLRRTFLEESRNQLTKKLIFLRNLAL